MDSLASVLVTHILVCLMLAIIFFVTWRTIEPKPHTLCWGLLFVVAAVKAILNIFPEIFYSQNFYWIFVNAMSLLIQVLGLVGHRLRRNMEPLPKWILMCFVLVELAVVWFTVVQPHMGLRMVFIPYSGGIMMLFAAWIIATPPRPVRAAEWGAVAVYVIFALSQILAGTYALMQGEFRDDYYLNLYAQVNFIFHPGAFSGLGLFTVLIVADDLADRMRQLAVTVQLTGVFNRRGFEEKSQNTFAIAKQRNTPVSIVVADIDHFKSINDTYGHSVGDEAIKSFAQRLRLGIRESDILGRVGGEEFVILLPNTELESAIQLVERVRENVASTPVQCLSDQIAMTASFGIAQLGINAESIKEMLANADGALYLAKESGRNRVAVYAPV